jgi:NitT/TauT family transport system substrate-binding protein
VKRFILALILAVTCSSGTTLAQTDDTVIRAAGSLTDTTTPLLYASQSKLFERAGLKVDVQRFTTGASIATAVAGGSLDVGLFNMFSFVQAHAKGLPFVLIAPGSVYDSASPDSGLLVSMNSPLRNAKDFAGKTIGALSLQDLSTFAVESWLDKSGGDAHSVKFVEVPQPLVIAALESGRVDAASASEPILGEALATGRFRVAAYTGTSIAPRWLATAWYTTKDFADRHPALIRKLVVAIREASLYVNTHPTETLPIIAAYMGVDPAAIAKIRRAKNDEYLDPRELQPVIEVAAKYKAIPAVFPAQEMISPLALRR